MYRIELDELRDRFLITADIQVEGMWEASERQFSKLISVTMMQSKIGNIICSWSFRNPMQINFYDEEFNNSCMLVYDDEYSVIILLADTTDKHFVDAVVSVIELLLKLTAPSQACDFVLRSE